MIKNSENTIQLKNATGYKTVLYGIILILEDMHSQSRAIFNPTNTDMQNMASGPITSWQIDGETVETVSDFILGWLQSHCRW